MFMRAIYFAAILTVMSEACKKREVSAVKNDTTVNLVVTAPETGYIYVNGDYSGSLTSRAISLTKGKYVIGVALQNSYQYLRKEVALTEDATINLTMADKPTPKQWKALWIGLYETKGNLPTGDCSTHFSKAELDLGYDFFQWSIANHFEKYAYGTMKWEVERKDIEVAVQVKKGSNSWYTVEPDVIANLNPAIQPGAYDCVFVFWRESEGNCNFGGNYFGLAWTNPMAEPIKTGYVTVKFNAGTSVADKINDYKTNDPGVWIHEWLHTVGEKFYQDRGKKLPQKADDGLVVHAAQMYGYTFPWMDWYKDFVSGRVPNSASVPKFLGIGPETFLNCTIKERATNTCN